MQPVSRSRKAIVALVFAVLGALVGWAGSGILTTPLALGFGCWALYDIRHRRAVRGRRMAWVAIVLSVAAPVLWVGLYLAAPGGGGAGFG